MSGGYQVLGNLANANDQGTNTGTSLGTTVTNSGTAGTYGSYTQLVASTPSDTCRMMVTIEGGNFSNSNNMVAKIAIGAGGSEIDLISNMMFFNASSATVTTSYMFPVNIPAGTRISAASAGSQSGADSISVQVILFDGTFEQTEGSGVDSIGVAAAKGTSVPAGAANTKGAYAQLTASSSRDYLGFCFAFDAIGAVSKPTSSVLFDIAIGAGGSEVVILPNYFFRESQGSNQCANIVSPVFPIQIPAGTRIAARQQNAAGVTAVGVSLYGIYQ